MNSNAGKLILTVDRNQRNLELLAQFLNKEGYETLPVSSLEGFDQIFEQVESLVLALVDISGFDRRIWEYCEKLSSNDVPLLVISPPQLSAIRQESLMHGADGVLFKPLMVAELMKVIRSLSRDILNE
jgi:DNA-binding response OmpR family regulator